MPVLTAQDLSKSYGPQLVLDGVAVTIGTGERVGLVGTNGSGKSTLARILVGAEAPDAGTVARRRDASIAYLEQEPELDPERTVLEIAMSGLAGWSAALERHRSATAAVDAADATASAIDDLVQAQSDAAAELERLGGWNLVHRAEAILENLGVARTDARISTLSGGERRRVALARILVSEPALAILDEPTNHLDVDAIEWLETFLVESHRGAVLLITHDRYVLDRVAERTLELERGRLHSYVGGYGAYIEAKADRLAHESRVEANRQNFLRREIEWLRRGPKARTTKQKARIGRAEAVLAIEAPQEARTARLAMDAARSGKTVLDLRDVTLALGGRTLVRSLSHALVPGERIGIIGRNGTGKTTLLRAILGEIAPMSGEIVRGAQTRIAYFDQARVGLDDDASIFDNIASTKTRIELGGRTLDVRSYLEAFLFETPKQRQKVGSLSGGERARVALAKMMSTGANLVLFDEPTNDLDVATLGALEQMLVDFGGSAMIVSHDRWFLDRVATSILAFEGEGEVVHQPGNYETYRSLLAQRRAREGRELAEEAAPTRAAPPTPAAAVAAAGPKPLTYAERIELEGILEHIDAAERRVAEIEARLGDPALYGARGEEVPAVLRSLEAAREEVARLMARWEALEARAVATAR